MTATEQLRKLLDERGVGTYKHEVPEAVCLAYFDGARWHDCWESTGGEVNVTFSMTPEQAVAATLAGTYTREDVEGAFVSGYSLGSLPVGSDPQWDENRQTVDEHMAELGWVRKDAATLGRGTCHDVYPNATYCFTCSECGHVRRFIQGWNNVTNSSQDEFNFCPNCGRKVVGE